jgi:hypothetical protein
MFGLISKRRIVKYLDEIKESSKADDMIVNFGKQDNIDNQKSLKAYSQGYEHGTNNVYNALLYRFSLKK